ncbi:MAG: hypothetical protein ACSHWU_02535 [Marinicella sp.]
MENDNKDQLTSDEAIVIEADTESVNTEKQTDQQVIKQKSSGGFSLLVAILALVGTGYLYYKDYTGSTESSLPNNQQLKALQVENEGLKAELNALKTDLSAFKSQIDANANNINQLTNQFINSSTSESSPAVTAFDNSENETALNTVNDQLTVNQNSIQQLTQRLNQLANQLSNQSDTQASQIAQKSPEIEPFNHKATLETLMVTELLLANQQIEQATHVLSTHLSSANIQAQTRTQINQLLRQLRSVQMPNKEDFVAELTQIRGEINALQIPTETKEVSDPHWYERFISVKKISEESSSISNSASLAILKSRLNNHLLQAELAMVMQNQSAWQLQLESGSQLILQQLPLQTDLVSQLAQMAEKQITPSIPEGLGIQSIIAELQGMR